MISEDKDNRQTVGLPLVIPLLICHGRRAWPKDRVDFASLFEGPVDILRAYVPDFRFELYDLRQYSDDEIRGTIMARVVLLLFKHVFDADLMDKLPGILGLMRELMSRKTGLQYLEVVLRYLFSTVDDVTTDQLKQVVEKALSAQEGEYIMTLAEKLRMEGRIEGEVNGEIKGLTRAIELGLKIRFPDMLAELMAEIYKINDSALLKQITNALETAKSDTEIRAFLN